MSEVTSLGVEIGSTFFMGVYKKNGKLMCVSLDDGDCLFAAQSRYPNGKVSYGTSTLGAAFNGSSVFTNMCLFYLTPAKDFSAGSIEYYSPVPLRVNAEGFYEFNYQFMKNKYWSMYDPISSILQRMKVQYEKMGKSLDCMTCTLPDAYYYSRYTGRVESLKGKLAELGIPRLEFISERDAVLEFLKQKNSLSDKTIIICCGEAFNSYTTVNSNKQPVTYPTPHYTGYSLISEIMKEIVRQFNQQQYNAGGPMSYEKEKEFKKNAFFSARISMFNYLSGKMQRLVVHTVCNQKEYDISIDDKTCTDLFTTYATKLANHAYARICSSCLHGERDLSQYKVFVCGDYAKIPQLQKAIMEKFNITNENQVIPLNSSVFATGALLSIPPNVKVVRKETCPISYYPMSTVH